MTLAPTATEISVSQVLAKFDDEFASIASAVENGKFSLWVGSGISRKAPNLGDLIRDGLEALRLKVVDPDTSEAFRPALEEALELAGKSIAEIGDEMTLPVAQWSLKRDIVNALWNQYSRFLDIRVEGTASDYLLWDAVDIRQQFAHPAPPAAPHLCIAILILEGAVNVVASGNWDGFIEAAVDRLGAGASRLLQVVVDPGQLRDEPGRAQLLKFHGCILHATQDQTKYRRYLTGSHAQIAAWPHNDQFEAMRNVLVGIATAKRSMLLGLSIQDMNLQGVFTQAAHTHPWPWPCAPEAPGHVFCEERVQPGQKDVLKIVYGDAYNANLTAINSACHIRAWGEQVLVALALRTITDKLQVLMRCALEDEGQDGLYGALSADLRDARDRIAQAAIYDENDGSRTPAVNAGIAGWSRILSVYRFGRLQSNPLAYEAISPLCVDLLETDQNAKSTQLGHLAIILSLFNHGEAAQNWELTPPANDELPSGVACFRPGRDGAEPRPLFVVKSASEAIMLEAQGGLQTGQEIVIHADDLWEKADLSRSSRRPGGPPGRTGEVAPTHVSVGALLKGAADVDVLRNDFAVKVVL